MVIKCSNRLQKPVLPLGNSQFALGSTKLCLSLFSSLKLANQSCSTLAHWLSVCPPGIPLLTVHWRCLALPPTQIIYLGLGEEILCPLHLRSRE